MRWEYFQKIAPPSSPTSSKALGLSGAEDVPGWDGMGMSIHDASPSRVYHYPAYA